MHAAAASMHARMQHTLMLPLSWPLASCQSVRVQSAERAVAASSNVYLVADSFKCRQHQRMHEAMERQHMATLHRQLCKYPRGHTRRPKQRMHLRRGRHMRKHDWVAAAARR